MTTFIVNGTEKELRYNVNGIDISGDFIGNTAHGMSQNDDGHYLATQDDFDWWQNTIAAHENLDAVIANYKMLFDDDAVDQIIADWAGGDLDDAPSQIILGLQQAFGELVK